ncbi:cytochrome c oxidase subunit II [Bosea sp. BK604]|uniref:cytochrome c oxidase subunit II n=1 Tax=Bosea sp. BK604 TaxID=2512180 RepID=UPI001046B6F4|nr:cytochrome c oxidase subunit II [Bosea sp. BK604]TCR65707.1 cytochrome c oxidase subunit 2 [Bosea sp. BK604]
MSVARLTLLVASLPALAGCSEIQSALAPRGPDAERILTLGLVLLVGAIAILLIVLVALVLALYGSDRWRRRLASANAVKLGGLAFPIVTLTILLGYGIWLMREELAAAVRPPALRIEVTGEQWWWRLAYLQPDGSRIAEANEIRIPVGQEVEFALNAADVIHSFWVPSLGGKLDMVPGRTNRLRLTAQREGIYRGQCAEYCGGPHALMALEIVAMPAEAFERWLAAAASPPEPVTEAARAGRDLFHRSGCGACHAIRGTEARGAVGPDLSRLGGRRFLAAASLRLDEDSIGRFIHDGQSLKPGNQMPEFRIFSATELRMLSAYLASLK